MKIDKNKNKQPEAIPRSGKNYQRRQKQRSPVFVNEAWKRCFQNLPIGVQNNKNEHQEIQENQLKINKEQEMA